MKLASFNGGRVGLAADDGLRDLTEMLGPRVEGGLSPMRRLIARWPELRERAEAHRAVEDLVPWSEVTFDPVVPDPSKIVAAPVNYVDHIAEMNVDYGIDALGVFLKAPSSVLGSGGKIVLPYADRRFDQEGELAAVIGSRVSRVNQDDALDHVFGYTPLLDITMRGGEDRSTRKSFDSFTPVGPWVVTPDDFGSPAHCTLKCWVGDELRQDADTADLIWGLAKLISYASSVMTLEVGDIVTTGTPAGVGPIEVGDTVRLELEGVGRDLEVRVATRRTEEAPTGRVAV